MPPLDSLPLSGDETELIADYRLALPNDRQLLRGLLQAWPSLSPAQRAAIHRVADLFSSRSAWRISTGGAR